MSICCTICSEIYAKKDEVVVTPQCGHLFHKKCLKKWFFRSETCPKCRQSCNRTSQRIFLDWVPKGEENASFSRNAENLKKQILQLKAELQNSNENLAELQAINLSLQNLPENQAKFDADNLQEQLQIALHQLHIAQNEKKKLDEKYAMKMKLSKSDKNNSFEKQIQHIEMDKKMIEEDYQKARIEIIQLRCQVREFEMQSKLDNFNKTIENVCVEFRNRNSLSPKKKSSDDESEDGAKCLTVMDDTKKNCGNPFLVKDTKPYDFNYCVEESTIDANSNSFQKSKNKFDKVNKSTIYNMNRNIDNEMDFMFKTSSLELRTNNIQNNKY